MQFPAPRPAIVGVEADVTISDSRRISRNLEARASLSLKKTDIAERCYLGFGNFTIPYKEPRCQLQVDLPPN